MEITVKVINLKCPGCHQDGHALEGAIVCIQCKTAISRVVDILRHLYSAGQIPNLKETVKSMILLNVRGLYDK